MGNSSQNSAIRAWLVLVLLMLDFTLFKDNLIGNIIIAICILILGVTTVAEFLKKNSSDVVFKNKVKILKNKNKNKEE